VNKAVKVDNLEGVQSIAAGFDFVIALYLPLYDNIDNNFRTAEPDPHSTGSKLHVSKPAAIAITFFVTLGGVGILVGAFLLYRKSKHMPLRDLWSSNNNRSPRMRDLLATESGPVTDNNSVSAISLTNVSRYLGNTTKATNLGSGRELKEIVVQNMLGSGKYGDVFQGTWLSSTTVALKRLKGDVWEEYESEAALLQQLIHPNIVTFIGVHVDRNKEHCIFDKRQQLLLTKEILF
jgi:hypothetical protein